MNVMKKAAILIFFVFLISTGNAQSKDKTKEPRYHQHKGFFLAMSVGPNFASITDEVAGDYNLKFNGTGAQFDFKIGGAIKENLILHATLVSNTMSGPDVTSGGSSQATSNNLSLGETMFGAGITYYYMPINIFFSGSLGIGTFSLSDYDTKDSFSTDGGFSMQLKVGKNWWISKKWGLGIAVTYGKTKLTNTPGGGVEEFMNSNNFGILFNASLN